MDHGIKLRRKIHPQENANCFSFITFFYTNSIFRKGYLKNLEEEDLYEVLTSFKSKTLGDQLENQLNAVRKNDKNASIYKLLWLCYGKTYLLIGLVQLIVRVIMIVLSPYAIGKLVAYFKPGQKELSLNDAYFYAAMVVGLNVINCLYLHNYMLLITSFGIKVRTAFCSIMYRKALRLSSSALSQITMGKIVTLLTKDIGAFEMIIFFGNDIWIGFVQAAVVCYLIYQQMGVAAFAGMGFFLVVMPFQIYIGKRASALRLETGRKTDERLQITQETISAIKIIKMYTWEKVFYNKITEARRNEVNAIIKIFFTKIIILLLGGLTSKIAFYFLVMTYIWMGYSISAELVYFILSCFQRLRHALTVIIPLGITQTAELYASVKRIDNLFKAEDIVPKVTEQMVIRPKIYMNNVTIRIKDIEILHEISLNLEHGLTIITGPVGSGKSSLVKTILKDYTPQQGTLQINGRISYASQDPWIFPSTIKQNIIFGDAFNQKRYQEVLSVCALKYDIEFFQNGDETIVGDRGLNLSKGQQARINLARAIYRQSDIYLFDDCLASLDAHVKDYVFRECIKGFLNDKLCILVTHNFKQIKESDDVIILDKGTIKSVMKSAEFCEKMKGSNENIADINKKNFVNEDSDEKDLQDEESYLLKLVESPSKSNIYHEVKKSGKVEKSTYHKYVKFGGGYIVLSVIMALFLLCQTSKSYTEKMVSNWVNLEQNLSDYREKNLTNTTKFVQLEEKHSFILLLFTGMTVATTILSIITAAALFLFSRRASKNMHKAMILNIINSVLQFFDITFVGNILNRFSKDLATLDEHLPLVLYQFFEILFHLCGIIILIATVNTSFLIPAAFFFIALYFVRLIYLPTGRNLQRLDAATRSPMLGYLNSTLEGLTTIRAYNAQAILKEQFDRHQDLYTSADYTLKCCTRAFGFLLDMLSSVFIAAIILRFMLIKTETSVGDVGLAITQAFMLSGLVQYGIRQWAELENMMTSVERVLEYTNLKQEGKTGLTIEEWPTAGSITYDKVSLNYGNDQVLKNISFGIEPRQKIGIVGRTGAGKSSIVSSLFRLYEVEGKIFIDGVDTKTLSLDFLRKRIAIIPQEPMLFSGSLRSNIDPMELYTDEEIWNVIERVKLKSIISSLDLVVTESGSNFSVGQRQLICLARAIVSNNKIVVLDEATSSMDPDTEDLIHNTIDENFSKCTVISIAHRLNSVLSCDKVLVLDQGTMLEYDSPEKLLENKNGVFHAMVKKSDL